MLAKKSASTRPAADPAVLPQISDLLRLRQEVRRWKLQPRQQSQALAAGPYRSRFKGRGMEFEEVRGYQAGDDIRHMDWKVTARTGRPHTKLYREERERPLFLLVDYSPGMFFGSRVRCKSVQAARIATLLAWSAMENHDRVGGAVFSGAGHHEYRPESGKLGVIRLINGLADAAHLPTQDIVAAVDLAEPLQRLRHVAKPGSVIFLISDFRGIGPQAEHHLARLRKHCELMAIHVSDPLEEQLPPPGMYAVSDGSDVRIVDSGSAVLQRRHHEEFRQRQQALQTLSKQLATPYLHVRTSDLDTADRLRAFLLRRPNGGRHE